MKDFTIRDLIYLIIIFVLIFIVSRLSIKNDVSVEPVKPVDTTYNRVVIDSIEYNIIKRDSIIVQIKDSIIYELQLNQTADDTTVVVNFQKLLSD
ncbi:hypothetical protein [uncultured phage cr49_1]|jgi:hypothetical protein|uniref:Uncharacterized protein n=1 Tax=uncultured phage cr49_1 TaxID=2986402 RepID=A0AAE7RTE5_9CAUD|nr:hypothetical protein M1M42_gp28 [uncultured phage cr49_1]QWM89059.1 hypothetical protein [uncultured phage cr49_1]